jgi:hypothetical protein
MPLPWPCAYEGRSGVNYADLKFFTEVFEVGPIA